MLINSLIDFLPEINKIENINAGGCGVVAAILGKHLQKYGNVEIVIYDWNYKTKKNIKDVRHKLKTNSMCEWEKNGINFYHLIIKFTWGDSVFYIDSTGVYEKPRKYGKTIIHDGGFTVEEMEHLIKNKSNWVDSFDRKNIRYIRKICRHFFKTFDMENLYA